jgi:hypothetical protein
MCRSNGSLVYGSVAGAGRLVRNAMVVVFAGRRVGWSCNVLTVQRSAPQNRRVLDLDDGSASGAKITAAEAAPTANMLAAT